MVNVLTDEKIRSGQSLIEALDAAGLDITAAYWFRETDNGSWKLGISERNLSNPRDFYKKVQKVMTRSDTSDLSLDDIVAVVSKSPVLRLLGSVFKTGRSIRKIEFLNNAVNGVLLPDMLIYRVA